jgi:hypothetical protein
MVAKPQTTRLIAYRWALTPMGYPLPIEQAKRGEHYVCPLCRGPMIARLGEQVQHHFAHTNDTGCTPEAVTRAALGRWITLQLRDALAKRQAIKVQWLCPKCKNQHQAQLLSGVSYVLEGYLWEPTHYADVAMVDAAGNVSALILVQDELSPTPETLQFFKGQEVFVLTIPASTTPSGSDFATLINQGQIVGAPCPMLQKATNIIQEPDAIRKALRDVVARWPGYFYGPLEKLDGLADVVRMGNQALWLPAERWRDIIGGTKNPLAPGIQVIMQTWPHTDGGVIWLYYAVVRDTAAIGVRRYGPGQTPMAFVDARFRQRQTTALDLVHHFVTQ